MKIYHLSFIIGLFSFFLISCSQEEKGNLEKEGITSLSDILLEKLTFSPYDSKVFHTLEERNPSFLYYLYYLSQLSPEWLILVDKNHKLPSSWSPENLVNLSEEGIPTHRKDIMLRSDVIGPLKRIIEAAEEEGVHLSIVSSYRDIAYQERLWETNLSQNGLTYTRDYIAEPGSSQHHLGSVVDFNLADEAFDNSHEALWLEKNALNYGWSISYPKDYENQTGYKAESWHFRYFPEDASIFIDTYFDGLQFAFLEFWHRNLDTIKDIFQEYQEF